MKLQIMIAVTAGILWPVTCAALELPVPQELNDQNVKVHFTVDSTWHTVHGKTSEITGRVWQEDRSDPQSVHATVNIPVKDFDTDNSSRDKELREVMAQPAYPLVTLEIFRLESSCISEVIQSGSPCAGNIVGVLSIRDVKKNVSIPYKLERLNDHYLVHGDYDIIWGEFHVEDPSILVARVAPNVTISFEVKFPLSQQAKR